MHLYFILAGQLKNRGEETGILCRVKIKSCIFSGHDDSVKVGVNQKKILVKKPLLMCYVLIKG